LTIVIRSCHWKPRRAAAVKGARASNQQPKTLSEMSTEKQREAAKRNIKKAAAAAKSKKTISHLPAKTRTALAQKGAEAAQKKR
jgi:hypothetical protein